MQHKAAVEARLLNKEIGLVTFVNSCSIAVGYIFCTLRFAILALKYFQASTS